MTPTITPNDVIASWREKATRVDGIKSPDEVRMPALLYALLTSRTRSAIKSNTYFTIMTLEEESKLDPPCVEYIDALLNQLNMLTTHFTSDTLPELRGYIVEDIAPLYLDYEQIKS